VKAAAQPSEGQSQKSENEQSDQDCGFATHVNQSNTDSAKKMRKKGGILHGTQQSEEHHSGNSCARR
jgi:hypothetical protein